MRESATPNVAIKQRCGPTMTAKSKLKKCVTTLSSPAVAGTLVCSARNCFSLAETEYNGFKWR